MNNPVRVISLGAIMASLLVCAWAISAETATEQKQAEIKLPKAATSGGMALTEALAKRRTIRTLADKPLSQEQVAQLCWAAQGITQEERGLRTAPSAMAQYPITVFVVDEKGLYEYQPKAHALRTVASGNELQKLRGINSNRSLASAPLCLIVAMDVKRMAGRGGEKAERYCLLEVGHVAQNILLQATALGLAGVPMGGVDGGKIAGGMGLSAQHQPVYLLPIGYPKQQ